MTTKIESGDPDAKPPYKHLVPIVEALIGGGNRLADSQAIRRQLSVGLEAGPYFYNTQGGWVCLLAEAIDFDLLRSTFSFPPTIHLSEEHNSIACDRTWIEITGNWANK